MGRILPPRLWEALARKLTATPAIRSGVIVGLAGVERVAGPSGVQAPRLALAGTDCPEPPELLAPW